MEREEDHLVERRGKEDLNRAKGSKVDRMREGDQSLIDSIRNVSQGNPAFRGEHLLPSDYGKISDRLKLSSILSTFGNRAFGNSTRLINYINNYAEMEKEKNDAYQLFLRQVTVYSLKPIADLTANFFQRMIAVYEKVMAIRHQHDAVRRKPMNEKAIRLWNELSENAHVLSRFLQEFPKKQLAVAKAIDYHRAAETDLSKGSMNSAITISYAE